MLKQYILNGKQYQFDTDKVPSGAIPVKIHEGKDPEPAAEPDPEPAAEPDPEPAAEQKEKKVANKGGQVKTK